MEGSPQQIAGRAWHTRARSSLSRASEALLWLERARGLPSNVGLPVTGVTRNAACNNCNSTLDRVTNRVTWLARGTTCADGARRCRLCPRSQPCRQQGKLAGRPHLPQGLEEGLRLGGPVEIATSRHFAGTSTRDQTRRITLFGAAPGVRSMRTTSSIDSTGSRCKRRWATNSRRDLSDALLNTSAPSTTNVEISKTKAGSGTGADRAREGGGSSFRFLGRASGGASNVSVRSASSMATSVARPTLSIVMSSGEDPYGNLRELGALGRSSYGVVFTLSFGCGRRLFSCLPDLCAKTVPRQAVSHARPLPCNNWRRIGTGSRAS